MKRSDEARPERAPQGRTGAHRISGERIEGHTLHLGRSKVIDTLVDTTFVDCTIRIHCGASNLTIARCTFVGCTFWPTREMRNLRLETCGMQGCTFRGRYSGARFGSEVRDCDFSAAASLDLCDFAEGADVASCRWPAWPHVTVVDALAHRDALEALDVSVDLAISLDVIAEPPAMAACTLDLSRYDDDPDALRAMLAPLPFVQFTDPSETAV